MTDIEYAESVRKQGLAIVTKCLRVEQAAGEGTEACRIARLAGMLAMEIVADAGRRIGQATLTADRTAVESGGYDLGALVDAPPVGIEE